MFAFAVRAKRSEPSRPKKLHRASGTDSLQCWTASRRLDLSLTNVIFYGLTTKKVKSGLGKVTVVFTCMCRRCVAIAFFGCAEATETDPSRNDSSTLPEFNLQIHEKSHL